MDLHLTLVSGRRLNAQVYGQIREAILEGRLASGAALPATRELARQLGVSRTTVEAAYDRLAGEGFVTARIGSGTYVREGLPVLGARPISRRDSVLRARGVWDGIALSRAFEQTGQFDFRTGLPDAGRFPHRAWRRLVARELRSPTFAPGIYGHPAGHPALREAIARHIRVSRGMAVSADEIVITSGCQQALDLVARVLLAPGDTVAVEEPGYQPPIRLFRSLGARVRGVPVDREGILVEAIPSRARLVYVTPSHQYPLGVTMSLPRRLALLRWAQRRGAAIVEDDYDSEFRFGGRPLDPLFTLDPSGRVIYVGSFSKTMLPTLRLGFVAVPASFADRLHRARFVADWHSPLLLQAALARFIDEGGFARHLRRMSRVYGARHVLLTELLARDFAPDFEVMPAISGLHVAVVARRDSVSRIERVAEQLSGAGVLVHPLAMFAFEARPLPGFALGYGAIELEDIRDGLEQLARVLSR